MDVRPFPDEAPCRRRPDKQVQINGREGIQAGSETTHIPPLPYGGAQIAFIATGLKLW